MIDMKELIERYDNNIDYRDVTHFFEYASDVLKTFFDNYNYFRSKGIEHDVAVGRAGLGAVAAAFAQLLVAYEPFVNVKRYSDIVVDIHNMLKKKLATKDDVYDFVNRITPKFRKVMSAGLDMVLLAKDLFKSSKVVPKKYI